MQLKFAFVAACLGMLDAASHVAASAIKARQTVPNLVYVTTDDGFQGNELFQQWTPGVCFNFPDDFQGDISSVAAVSQTSCNLYLDLDCPADAAFITIDQSDPCPDIDAAYPGWNDAISSAVCVLVPSS